MVHLYNYDFTNLVCVYVSASAAGYFKGATEHGITTAFKFVVADRESCSEEITPQQLVTTLEDLDSGSHAGAVGTSPQAVVVSRTLMRVRSGFMAVSICSLSYYTNQHKQKINLIYIVWQNGNTQRDHM